MLPINFMQWKSRYDYEKIHDVFPFSSRPGVRYPCHHTMLPHKTQLIPPLLPQPKRKTRYMYKHSSRSEYEVATRSKRSDVFLSPSSLLPAPLSSLLLTLSKRTWLFTFSFILPLDHFCKRRTQKISIRSGKSRQGQALDWSPTHTARHRSMCHDRYATSTICTANTFFFPLLELAAARALASFDFCSFGACNQDRTEDVSM